MNPLIHRSVYDILMQHYKHTGRMFLTRARCTERLRNGFLFIGDAVRYLQSTLWTGRDTLTRVYHIGIGVDIVDGMPQACFAMHCRNNHALGEYFEKIQEKILGTHDIKMHSGRPFSWGVVFEGDYQDRIRWMLHDLVPIVDEVMSGNNHGIHAIPKDKFEKCMKTISLCV